MNTVILFLVIAAIASILIFALLVIVIAGIHASERRMSLTRQPRTRSEAIARRVLGVHSELSEIQCRLQRPPRLAMRASVATSERCKEVITMTDSKNGHIQDPAHGRRHCPCGALTGGPALRLCRKCRSRSRYHWRRRHAPVTARHGRAGTGPKGRQEQK